MPTMLRPRRESPDRRLIRRGLATTRALVLAALPAFTRVRGYREARGAVLLAEMGRRALPAEVADAFTASLLVDTPALALVLGAGAACGSSRTDEGGA